MLVIHSQSAAMPREVWESRYRQLTEVAYEEYAANPGCWHRRLDEAYEYMSGKWETV